VIVGQYEKIVTTGDFCKDPVSEPVPDKDHLSVCKPSRKFLEPIQYVTELL
jgi:hypothetical protein